MVQKNPESRSRQVEVPGSLQTRGRGVSIVICSAVLWPRQPAGKFGNLVSPSLAALHDFGSLGSPPGTVVFLAEPLWIPAVSQHMRGTNSTSLRALSLEPTSLADSSREEGVSGSPKG